MRRTTTPGTQARGRLEGNEDGDGDGNGDGAGDGDERAPPVPILPASTELAEHTARALLQASAPSLGGPPRQGCPPPTVTPQPQPLTPHTSDITLNVVRNRNP